MSDDGQIQIKMCKADLMQAFADIQERYKEHAGAFEFALKRIGMRINTHPHTFKNL